ncbi:MAG: homoserine O-acetyltransferase [Bdellovibrionota bacterium]
MKLILIFLLPLFSVSSYASAKEQFVTKKEFHLSSYTTTSGEKIKNVLVGYESYGTMNESKSNVILVTHYFSGNSHAAGKYTASDVAPGYWDSIIGPGKPLDTNKYFIISSDCLVNLGVHDPWVRTTGPASINPDTGKPYGMTFPKIKVTDFVQVQRQLLNSLHINKLYAVVGASGGAAQAMEWATLYPNDVERVVAVVPPGLSQAPYVVALLNRWANPITLDPQWKNGNYDPQSRVPLKGLIESLKQITLSAVYFDFGPRDSSQIESFLEDRAIARAKLTDANSLIYTARAMMTFDVEKKAADIKAEVLFVPAEKDMIFPPELAFDAAKKLCTLGKRAEVFVMKGRGGHIDGLTGVAAASAQISQFLERPLGTSKVCE